MFKTTGDGFLVEFASAVQALRCAVAIQDALRAQPDGLRLRIGVHQGEVVPEGDDLLGDGVIVAARLEPLAEPGGICISARVREDAAGKMALEVDDLGEPALKNLAPKIRVFRVRLGCPIPCGADTRSHCPTSRPATELRMSEASRRLAGILAADVVGYAGNGAVRGAVRNRRTAGHAAGRRRGAPRHGRHR